MTDFLDKVRELRKLWGTEEKSQPSQGRDSCLRRRNAAIPKSDELWQHFKGTVYRVQNISTPSADINPIAGNAVHTETGKVVHTQLSMHFGLQHRMEDCPERLVFYSALDESKLWARPLSSFMAEDFRSETGWKFWRVEANKLQSEQPLNGP